MVYNYKEVLEKYGNNRYVLEKALDEKELYRIDNSIYSDYLTVDPLIVFSKKYPNAIITMDSAFYYYGLTDVIPSKVYLAIPNGSRTIKRDDVVQTFVSKEILYQGACKVLVEGQEVNMYKKERLLVELIRRKNKIPYDYYKEIIKNYRDIAYELDMEKVEDYISLYKNKTKLSLILRDEVF